MKKLISILVLLGLVSACAAKQEWVFYNKAGASKEQMKKDLGWCEASGDSHFLPVQRKEVLKRNGVKDMPWEQWVAECMKSYGYKAERTK